jgi:hypothetical protein
VAGCTGSRARVQTREGFRPGNGVPSAETSRDPGLTRGTCIFLIDTLPVLANATIEEWYSWLVTIISTHHTLPSSHKESG